MAGLAGMITSRRDEIALRPKQPGLVGGAWPVPGAGHDALLVLVANPAVLPAVLNQAHCQPIGRLAKVHEHCSGTIRARFLPSEAGLLLAAPASSWRTTCHSITSSAIASSLSGIWTPSALAVLRLITSSNLVGCSTGKSDGSAPLSILSTKPTARRYKSPREAPYVISPPASANSRSP